MASAPKLQSLHQNYKRLLELLEARGREKGSEPRLRPLQALLRRFGLVRDEAARHVVSAILSCERRYEDSFRRFLSHRALAALRADSDLFSGVILAARALPPLSVQHVVGSVHAP